MPQKRLTTTIAIAINLFASEKGDELYKQVRADNTIWHKLAREYFNKIYNQYKMFLDEKFIQQFPYDFLSCLWELKLLVYLNSIKQGEITSISKRKVSIPDFKWIIDGITYYIEATCASSGSIENYPYLNTKLQTTPLVRDCTIGYSEYRERLTASFREKANCKFDPISCDGNICKHKQNPGYKESIGNDGYIIAISMAKIDFINQPFNWRVDLSCFFPCSPYITIDINQAGQAQDTYHAYIPSFAKGSNQDKSINVDIFANDKYSHVSAVIISHIWQVLFPDLSKYDLLLNYGLHENDFILIHNPFASVPLNVGVLPVERELVATHKDSEFTIHTIGPMTPPFQPCI